MQFGICTSITEASAASSAGWDYVEPMVKDLLDESLPPAALPVPAANVLVPAAMKITGPHANPDWLKAHMQRVTARAKQLGVEILVFGSGGARNVPDGFSRDEAKRQIITFMKMSAEICAAARVTLAVEHLNRGECNIINTVAEAMLYVREVEHPNVRCLVDSYHLWLENVSLDAVADALPYLAHVHVADKEGRVPPGESGSSDYRPLFDLLKKGGYDRRISVEATGYTPDVGPRVVRFLKDNWNN